MRLRIPLALLLVAGMLVAWSGTSPAQTRREIRVAMSSFKFEPSILSVNEGDTVVLQIDNIDDKQRPHAVNSPYLSQVDFTVTGEGKQDVTKDGTKYVRVEAGKKAEITFVAKGRGQYTYVCNIGSHASNGMTGALIVWPAGYHIAK